MAVLVELVVLAMVAVLAAMLVMVWQRLMALVEGERR